MRNTVPTTRGRTGPPERHQDARGTHRPSGTGTHGPSSAGLGKAEGGREHGKGVVGIQACGDTDGGRRVLPPVEEVLR
jgi:hypothetical protein